MECMQKTKDVISKHEKFAFDFLDSDQCEDSPFIHRFQSVQNKYIYDVNTMSILRVDKVLWEIILDFGRMTKQQIISKYSDYYTPEQISSAYEQIKTAQDENGVFLSNRPQVLMLLSQDYIRKKLESERSILLLNVTENCNFECTYCAYNGNYINRHKHSKQNMDWSVAKKAIDDFLRQSWNSEVRSVNFYGGEPLLNVPLIRQAVDYVKENEKGTKIRFAVTTNGSLLQGKTAEFLAREEFNISVSLDGPREIHDRYRRTKNAQPTWALITSNVKAFLEKYPQYKNNFKFGFNAVIAPPINISELEQFYSSYELVTEKMNIDIGFIDSVGAKQILKGHIRGLDNIYKKFVDNLAKGKINETPSALEYCLQRKLHHESWLKFHKRFSRYSCRLHGPKSFPKKCCSLSVCIPGVRRTFVSVKGDYWPCERVSESEYLRIGRVNEGFDIPKIRQLLLDWVELSKNECKYCWCLHTCQVGCWSSICDGEKPTPQLKKQACRKNRTETHNLLVDYCSVLEKNPDSLNYMKDITLA